jgi:outer membrane immunogenic protein
MNILTRIVGVSALSIVASWTAASAADMPVKAKAAPAPAFSWQGFYIGAYAGAAWSDQATTSDPCLSTVTAACIAAGTGTYNGVPPSTYDIKPGFTGGGEIGYNWQPNPYTVLGLENKFGYMHLKGSYVQNPAPIGNGDTSAFTTLGNWYDVYTARVGIVNDRAMFFLEAGGATARLSTGVVDVTAPVTVNTTTSKTVTGWAGGAGLEYAFNSHWSMKAEYLVMGIASTVNGCSQVGGFPVGVIDCTTSHHSGVQMIDLGLNYRFSLQ